MKRVEDITAAIAELPPEDYRRLVEWFRQQEQARWDEQLDRDSAHGKLEFLFEEAKSESNEETVRNWPPQK